MSAGEHYPRECVFCDWASALACRDRDCRDMQLGEHRDDCASHSAKACDCLLDHLEAQ